MRPSDAIRTLIVDQRAEGNRDHKISEETSPPTPPHDDSAGEESGQCLGRAAAAAT